MTAVKSVNTCQVEGMRVAERESENRVRVSGETTTQTVSPVWAVAGECPVTAAINPSRMSMSQVDHSHLVCPCNITTIRSLINKIIEHVN